MQLLSLFGRVLFAAFFIISAWEAFEELRTDGVPTFKEFGTKFSTVEEFLNSKLGLAISHAQVAHAGALLFFIGMENSITNRGQDTKKKIQKTKTG